jgi:succinate-semialdehyde dehydrogenase/glutarate-semialdehyde dehydrogenase
MSLPTTTEEQLKASNEALKSLPCYTKHEPGTGEFAVLDSSTEERIATLPA